MNETVTAEVRFVVMMGPDEIPSPKTAALSFIADNAFRETLRLDISAVDRRARERRVEGNHRPS